VLECDVSGDETRIKGAARLIDVESGYTLWSQAYNRTRAKLFDVQQDVAQAVVGKLEIELKGRERQLVNMRWTESVEAYDEFLQGIRHQMGFPTEDDVAEAKQHLERAIELDPGFGRAYARLAINWVIAGNLQFEPAQIAYPEVKRLANKSIDLDGDLYEAYWALGWARFAGEYAWAAAERDFRKTIELAPGEWKGYHSLGYVHGVLGRLEQGFMAARMAIDLDPLAFYPRHGLEVLFTRQRQFEMSLKVVREQAELFGWNPMIHVNYAILLALDGQEQEARQHLEAAGSSGEQDAGFQLGIGLAHAILGDREQALAIARRGEERRRISEKSLWVGSLASIYALIGDKEQAMQYLLESRERQEMWIAFLDDPSFDSLRGDPRFAALVRELKLPEDRYLKLGHRASSD
jgi:tetratricopeptide (TPR) repeat protein